MPSGPSRSNSPCSTSTVARASASARWHGSVVAREVRREGGQLAVGHLVAAEQPAGEDGGVDRGRGRPGDPVLGARRLEEAQVERGVVRDEHRAVGELEEAGEHAADPRRGGDHRRGDAGQDADVGRDLPAGVDQRLELAEHLAAAHLDGADLGDRAVPRGAAGRLQVDHDEGDLRERRAQLLDRGLDVARAGVEAGCQPAPAGAGGLGTHPGGGGGRGWHAADGRSGVPTVSADATPGSRAGSAAARDGAGCRPAGRTPRSRWRVAVTRATMPSGTSGGPVASER